ncbi:hypothetical protein Drorol1_Dr00003891 [Drosera rotundifolia]
MASPLLLLLLPLLTTTLFTLSVSLCITPLQPYTHCLDLATLNSHLHYTYASPNLSILFLSPPPSPSSGWVSFAINPTSTGMRGSQAFLAYTNSSSINLKLYNISSYSEIIETEELGVKVYDKKAEWIRGVIGIYATVEVPEGAVKSGGVNYVWQVGPGMTNGRPIKHEFTPANLASVGKLSLTDSNSGGTPVAGGGGGGVGMRKRNIHGILNAVSWGILFPVGAIIARYLRVFPSADPAWFYVHASCQVSAYAIGVAGWSTGLKLGSESKGIVFTSHRCIGITLFCLATIQIFALLIRPKKEHKLRLYWNIYHHSIGYAIIILGAINIYKGLSILNPEHKWKLAYTIILIALGGISALLEVVTWIVVWRRKSSTKPYA